MSLSIRLAEKSWLPDSFIRFGIRKLLRERLRSESVEEGESLEKKTAAFVRFLSQSPIAAETQAANEQHYELPPEFFEKVLGPRLKYSSCYWEKGATTLAEAETHMLEMTAERAGIRPGQSILDLGCGWGSFTLWAAERFEDLKITAVSNSSLQGDFIRQRAEEKGLNGIEVLTRDMNRFEPSERYDRIVSIEMLEHLRNYPEFFGHIREWLKPEGQFFAHIFCHRRLPYAFQLESSADWMARFFFTGGIMPSRDLFRSVDRDIRILEQWDVNGLNYSKTLEAWLSNHDRNRHEILELFSSCYGPDRTEVWFQRWRIFLMACSEMFRFRAGKEWLVGHYLFGSK